MKILALDPATKLGYAHSSGLSGTEDFSVRARESTGSRLRRLYGWLRRFHEDCPFDLLVFESAIVYTKHASGVGVSFEMQGVIQLWCEENGLDYRGFNVSEVKKHATGKGNSGKADMRTAAIFKWPGWVTPKIDNNAIDARWLLDLAMKEYGG